MIIQFTYLLQEYDGKFRFSTDAWTSLNHKAFVTLTVHLKHEGKPLTMLLDIVEVTKSNDFPGHANQTWCFAHTLSISAEAVLKQFDIPKTNSVEALYVSV